VTASEPDSRKPGLSACLRCGQGKTARLPRDLCPPESVQYVTDTSAQPRLQCAPFRKGHRFTVDPNNQTPPDEKLAHILRAAAVETDSDKLLELYRKMAKLDQENDTSSRGNANR
jgi:hypothetical protein